MGTPKLDLRPGMTLGRNYYIVEFLGSGWEGEVYKVEERRTGIVRAAKIFYEDRKLSNAQLKRYANKMYRLRRCPIVTQYHHRDVARVGRNQVEMLVSDFAEGELLSDYIARQRGKRLPEFQSLHLLHALAVGVEPIHYLGEYHGDIHSDNILVKRQGLGFNVSLVDFFDLGKSMRERMFHDVIDLVTILYECIGEAEGYRRANPVVKQIIAGRKHSLIRQRYKTAGQLRLALENLVW